MSAFGGKGDPDQLRLPMSIYEYAGLASTPPEDSRDDDVEADERSSVDHVSTPGLHHL